MRPVDVRLPLALLLAMQEQDTPPELLPDENPELSFPQRLGLSGVVERQIREFSRLARRGGRVDLPQVEALVRLIARRPDAERIFDAAGRELARVTIEGAGRLRRVVRFLPESLRYRAAARALRSVDGDILLAQDISVRGWPFQLRLSNGLTARADPDGTACHLYAALAVGVMALHGVKEARVEHVRCQARGHDDCAWEAVRSGSTAAADGAGATGGASASDEGAAGAGELAAGGQ